jgi:hypothetical protein
VQRAPVEEAVRGAEEVAGQRVFAAAAAAAARRQQDDERERA